MEIPESVSKTRAIVFSDIQGYSRLMGANEPLAMPPPQTPQQVDRYRVQRLGRLFRIFQDFLRHCR